MSKLQRAVQNQDVETVRELLETKEFTEKVLSDALYTACGLGNYELARLLIDKGANVNGRKVPLQGAIVFGHTEIVQLLLENGVDPNVEVDHLIPIISASRDGYLDIVRLLLQYGADVAVDDNYAIGMASQNGHLEVVRLLLENGADPTVRDNYALIWASYYNYVDVVRLLLQHGADPTAAIQRASEKGYLDIVQVLLENGANPTVNDNYAIRWASRNGHTEVVRLLLQYGADPTAEDNSAIRMASFNGYIDVVKLLLQDTRVNPSAVYNDAIINAMSNNHIEIMYLLSEDPRVIAKGIPDNVRGYMKIRRDRDISQVVDAAMALRSTGFDPYVISKILSFNMPAYDVSNIVATVAPIVRPYSLLTHPDQTPTRGRSKILRHKYQPKINRDFWLKKISSHESKIAKLQNEFLSRPSANTCSKRVSIDHKTQIEQLQKELAGYYEELSNL